MNLLVKAKERKTGATHTEVTARKGTVRRTKSGKVTTVRATTATVHKKDDLIPIGTPVYLTTEGKPRAFRGSIIGHENGNYHVEGLRQGYQFKADKYLLPKEQVWTHEEHQARKQKPKKAKYESLSSSKRTISVEEQNRRKTVSEQRFDMPENEILTNPAITETMRRTLVGIASTNKITPLVRLNNGFVSSDVPEMNDMISEYTTAMMNSLRLELSQASEEDLKEFKQHLAGEKQNSRILATVTTAGRGAAIRHIKDRNKKLAEMTDFQTVDNDPVMRRELSQHATPAHQEEDLTAKPIHLTVKIIKLLHKLTPLHAQVIKKKFGILRGEPLNNEKLAEHLNQAGTPRPDGRKWTRDNVAETLNSAISEISKQEGVEALRDFHKSLKELMSLKKSGHAGITARIVKGFPCLIFESESLAKSYSSDLIANYPGGRWITVKEGPLAGRHIFILPHKDGSATVLAGGGPAFRTKSGTVREPQANLGDKLHQGLLSGKLSKREFLKQRKQVKTDLKTAKADLKEGMKSGNGAKIKQAQDAIKEHTEKLGHYETVHKKHDFLTDAQKKQLQWFRDKQTKVMPDYDHFHEALAKVGGIDADEAYRQWGLSIREYPALKESRILANPLKAKGGLHPDKAAEILAQHGFVATDSHGKHDFRDFENKLLRAAAGEKIHGNAHSHDESELKEAEERYAREHYGNSENSNLDDLMDFFDSVGVKKSLQRHIATWHRKGKREVVEDLAKALGYSNKGETTMNLTKSHVKGYTRRSKSGNVTQVNDYDNTRQKAASASQAANDFQAKQDWSKPDTRGGANLHAKAGLLHLQAMHAAYKAGDSKAMRSHDEQASMHLSQADGHLSHNRRDSKVRASHESKIADALSNMANNYKTEHNHHSLDYGSRIHLLAAEHHNRASAAHYNGNNHEKGQAHRNAAMEHGKKVQEICGVTTNASEHAHNASDRARIGGDKPEHHLDAAKAHRKAAQLNFDDEGRATHERLAAEHEAKAKGKKS